MNRRHFIATAGLAASQACTKKTSTSSPPKATLEVYTWANYIGPEVVSRFEQENNCSLSISTFASNEEMHSKLKAGATGYDIIYPSSYMIEAMLRENLLQKLDPSLLPNTKHLDSTILANASGSTDFSVPYTTTYTCLGYRKSKVASPEPSFKMFERADLKGRMTLMDDMRESIGAALLSLGHNPNTKDQSQLDAAKEVLMRWKQNIAKFSAEDYTSGLASAEFFLSHGYSGDLYQVAVENEDIGILLPKEGMIRSVDEMVVPKGAKNAVLAHKLINFLLDPQVAAANMESTGYICPNKDAMPLLSEKLKKHPSVDVPADILAKCVTIRDLGADLPKYTKIWDEVKAAAE